MAEHEITHELRVRYAECDAQGIVFNARWFEYFDVAMTEFWREVIGGYQHLPVKFGVETVVAETGARFRGAGRFDEEALCDHDSARGKQLDARRDRGAA